MGLESATYISGLVSSNPTTSDFKTQGDDHLRLVKATLLNTFPNIAGAVTPTHTELNYVDGVTSAIQTQLDAKATVTGTTYTPVDGSGAGLTLALAVGAYLKLGKLVFVRAAVQWPVTANANTAAISVPFTSASYGVNSGMAVSRTDYGSAISVEQTYNTNVVTFWSYSGTVLTNANLSGKIMYFSGCYEASS